MQELRGFESQEFYLPQMTINTFFVITQQCRLMPTCQVYDDINLTNDNESGEQEEEEDYDVNWEYAPAQVSSRRRSIMLS